MATPIEDIVQPRAATTETAPVEARAGAPEQPAKEGGVPDEILQIPAMQALFAGQPAAVSASITEFGKRPDGKLIQSNKDVLMKAGISFYRGLDGDTGVIFNQMYLNGEELKSADEAGQLAQIAPHFDQVNSSVAQSGANNPVLNASNPSGQFKTAPVKAPPQSGSAIPTVPPAGAGVQNQAQRARQKNMAPGSPTSGPKPGSGRLLASILKPVV